MQRKHLSRGAGTRIIAGVIAGAGVLGISGGAVATAAVSVPPGFTVSTFASGSGPLNNPDDIARLDGNTYVGYQNGVSATGGAGPGGILTSTVIEYNDAGQVVNQWMPTGRIDGMAADPLNHLVYLTSNEDANSSFYIINPTAAAASQLQHLTYNDPQHVLSGAATSSGGGTDAVSVDPFGDVYISVSNPGVAGATAVAQAQIGTPSGEVTLSPTFADNLAGVRNGNGGGSETLALTDPDSNSIVPAASPLYANEFMLDSQGDGQLIFAPFGFSSATGASSLTELTLSGTGGTSNPQVDDVRWASSDGGVLYVIDQGGNAIDKISGPFEAGQVFAAQPADGAGEPYQGDVVTINLSNGVEMPFATGFGSPKGLLYVSPLDDSALPFPTGPTGPTGPTSPTGPTARTCCS